MDKKIFIFIGITIFIGVLFIFNNLNPASDNFDQVPQFSLKDYNGNEIELEDLQGKILVINSWAVWCPFCREELSDFIKLQQEFQEEIIVIAINRAESLEKGKGFTDSIGITDEIIFLLDPSDSFYASIGGFSMPETLFVDRQGNIKIHKRGPMQFEEMKEKIISLL